MQELFDTTLSALPEGFSKQHQMCLGFFQSSDRKLMKDYEAGSNLTTTPAVLVLSASKEVAKCMKDGRCDV